MSEKKRNQPFTVQDKLELYDYRTQNPTVPFSDVGTVLNRVAKMFKRCRCQVVHYSDPFRVVTYGV